MSKKEEKEQLEEKEELQEFKPYEEAIKGLKKKNTEKRKRKAVFIERFLAFFIDTMIISFACTLLATPFLDKDRMLELQKEETKIMTEIRENTANSQDVNTMLKEYKVKLNELGAITYELSREQGSYALVIIIAELLYFVVFQLYNNGQTVGKKLLKIKVTSTVDKNLTSNQLLFRSLIINSILFNIIDFAFMIFSNKYIYWQAISIFNIIQNIILLICAIMVMFRKDGLGLHDCICKTEVIKE